MKGRTKKGLSDVVTTVLIILLAVAAVSAIWLLIKPLIESSGKTIESKEVCLNNEIDIKNCQRINNSGELGYNIAYIRTKIDEKSSKLTNILAILSSGSKFLIQNQTTIQSIGEVSSINILTGNIYKRVYISAEYTSSEGGARIGCETTKVLCAGLPGDSNLSSSQQEEENNAIKSCGNNVIDSAEECDGSSIIHQECSEYNFNNHEWMNHYINGITFDSGSISCYAQGEQNECTLDFRECIWNPSASGSG